jgi:hypothetical protein
MVAHALIPARQEVEVKGLQSKVGLGKKHETLVKNKLK